MYSIDGDCTVPLHSAEAKLWYLEFWYVECHSYNDRRETDWHWPARLRSRRVDRGPSERPGQPSSYSAQFSGSLRSGGRRTRWWFELLRATEHQLSVREIGFPRTAAAPAKVERWQEEVNVGGGVMVVGG